ncbi:54S ribosomal protein L6 mitochondrial [Sporothrix stenoceras]|uniref:54S ribosomal protein L6 mitochondrial n=1 Tax=Sporothrix stenoceras TaxID=5173 RepID=A0ABR3ZQ03_9PEZI
MFAPRRGQALARAAGCSVAAAAASATRTTTTSRMALPAISVASQQCTRAFSATTAQNSKLGRTPISIPPNVELTIGEPIIKKDPTTYLRVPRRTISVQGPLGQLQLTMPPFVHLEHDANSRRLSLSVENRQLAQQREMWGTMWALINRHIIGVSEGHTAVLRLVGIGYRATVEERPELETYPGQKFVVLKLGFNHPVEMGVPKGISASTPQPTRVLLEGIDREELMTFAASIRRWRRPEPYKGKGIFVNEETIKLKQKKIK